MFGHLVMLTLRKETFHYCKYQIDPKEIDIG